MKIAIIGYGKMGHEIEKMALANGHEVVVKLDNKPMSDKDIEDFTTAEVAIEFSEPEAAVNNFNMCFNMGIPVVSGTTGWLDHYDEIRKLCIDGNHSFFYSPNFSLGVNLFFEINRKLAKLMNKYDNYDINVSEVHSKDKLDIPSGTAIRIAEDICENTTNIDNWSFNDKDNKDSISIKSGRENNVIGNHTVNYESDVDSIELTHKAKNRKGFATGAIVAAEFLINRKGFCEMKDLLGFGE